VFTGIETEKNTEYLEPSAANFNLQLREYMNNTYRQINVQPHGSEAYR
jgi:hypothetical protein